MGRGHQRATRECLNLQSLLSDLTIVVLDGFLLGHVELREIYHGCIEPGPAVEDVPGAVFLLGQSPPERVLL